MARCLRVGFMFAGLLLGLFNGVTAEVLDFTCVTKPRVDIETENASITSYFVPAGPNTTADNVELTFSRVKFVDSDRNITGTTERLSSVSESYVNAIGAIHRMGNDGKEMVGAFACKYKGKNVTKVFIMSLHTVGFLPETLSQTVNRNDAVHLTVTATTYTHENVWKKPGNIEVTSNTTNFNINQARIGNSSIYEIHYPGRPNDGTQAFIQLLVRGCEKNKWKDGRSCSEDCPVCLNGGVCKHGVCICPPGFKGHHCEVLLGPNAFGQKGSLSCNGPGLGDVPTCEGKLFCLPNPYGCSCAAGYKGIDCNETCHSGLYGADCLQTCNCMNRTACNATTGVCVGPCASGFTGNNCQDKCLPLNGSLSCSTTCTTSLDSAEKPGNPRVLPNHSLSWNPVVCLNGTAIQNYVYRFSKTESQLALGPSDKRVEGTSLQIQNLTPCTQYTFKVAAETTKGIGPFSVKRFTTATRIPDPVKDLEVKSVGFDFIELSWNAPGSNASNPCNATTYLVSFKLVNLQGCRQVEQNRIQANPVEHSVYHTTGINAFSAYTVSVRPNNTAGLGLASHINATTLETNPEKAPGFNDSFATSDSVTFSWHPISCGSRGGNITGYSTRLVHFREVINVTNVTAESVTFNGLSPCTHYTLEVRAFTKVGSGKALIVNETTHNAALEAVRNITILPTNISEIKVEWTAPWSKLNRCRALSYQVTYELVNLEQCKVQNSSVVTDVGEVHTNAITIEGLANFSTYKLNVVPKNMAGPGRENFHLFKTKETAPAISPSFSGVNASHESITFSWYSIPCGRRGGDITHYYYKLKKHDEIVRKNRTTKQSVTFLGLLPCTSYTFKVRAHTRVGPGPWAEIQQDTNVIDKNEPRPTGGSSAGLTLGVIVCLLIIITVALMIAVFVKKRRQRKEAVVNTAAAVGNRAKPAIAGNENDLELQNLPSASGHEPFADSSATASTDQPQTPPTNPSTCTKTGDAESSSAASNISKPGSSASAMPAVKPKPHVKSTRPKLKTVAKSQPVFSQTGPVTMAHLAQYIKSRKSGKINGFQQDYETIPSEPLHPWTVAKKDYNRTKNRYTNILPYDHSRVVLETIEDNPQSDYINASYINGYKHKSRYIACQGPTVSSVNDMWRMVWQERVGKIVMLANLVENGKGKCEQYWPDDGGADFGEMFVRNVDEASQDNYIVRTFHLSKKSEPEGEYRVVTQFHYTTWPDMKPPEASPLLQFLRKVRASETTQQGPIVVHCSAGVGRTGTFIALDAMLEQAQAEGQVDVLSFARDMREQRFLMVQTLDQYKFIFDALLESMLSENTAIPADRFQHDYAKLKKRDKKTGTSGIEDQFQMLESFNVSPTSDQCAGGLTKANVDKNRFKHWIPKDSIRPYLMTEGDEGSTNYINAAFLDGYKGKYAYIGTQAPLPNTVGDIWRMVFDYKSTCIVMLNSMDSDPRIAKYWPEKDELKSFGPLNVTLRFEDRRWENLIIRHFEIVRPLRKSDEVQSVCQIQYLGWPTGKDVPVSAANLLQVLLEVRRRTDDHPDGPITVHCIDGVECTGAFCILITLLDHLKEEKVVDVFQAVKKLRTIRPGVVQNLAQYQFCYKVMQTYLDSSSVYENLK